MADESSMDLRHGTNVDCPRTIADTPDLGNEVVIENDDDKEEEVVSLRGVELSRSDRSLLFRSSGKHDGCDEMFSREQIMITKYLLDNVPQFRTLLELKSKVFSIVAFLWVLIRHLLPHLTDYYLYRDGVTQKGMTIIKGSVILQITPTRGQPKFS
jgi:hypothetical protein